MILLKYNVSMMIKTLIIIIGLLFNNVFSISYRRGRNGNKQAMFERFNKTCGNKNVFIIFDYDGMKIEGTKLVMNSTITVKEDLVRDLRTIIHIDRCHVRENLDSCEYFYDHKLDDYCAMISIGNAAMVPFFNSFEPKFQCPVKKGVYKAFNTQYDYAPVLLFPTDAFFWRMKIEVFEKVTNRTASCLLLDAHFSSSK